MPKGPKGEKRPADVIGGAPLRIAQIVDAAKAARTHAHGFKLGLRVMKAA
jgi:hypothetical protein